MATDPRRIAGSMVEAKACHVTNLAECARRYGSNSKTKRVQGVVTHVEVGGEKCNDKQDNDVRDGCV